MPMPTSSQRSVVTRPVRWSGSWSGTRTGSTAWPCESPARERTLRKWSRTRSGPSVGRSTPKGESAFGSWLYRIAANAAYMKLRARRGKGREIALDDVLPALDSGGVHFDPMDDWWLRVYDRALQGDLRTVLASAIA